MQVWPGLWEYLRLALPCVAMVAVEWWSFDPQIQFQRVLPQHPVNSCDTLDAQELLGLMAGYFHSPETCQLNMGIWGFSALESLPVASLLGWGDGVMGQDQLAAHVTAANVSAMLYLSGSGAQKATAALVGGRNTN